MASTAPRAEGLRDQTARSIRRATDLIGDLKALAAGLGTLLPRDADRTETERWRDVARLTGRAETMPERLEGLVETLADVRAGLTSADDGAHWLEHRRARLEAGEDDSAAG